MARWRGSTASCARAIPFPGISERAVFIVGKDGKLKFAKVYPISQVPDVEEVFEVLRKL